MKANLVLVLCLLFSLSSAAYLERPWEDQEWVAQNPNIWSYGFEFWWNVPVLHGSLDSLDVEEVSHLGINGSTAAYVNQSLAKKQEATADKEGCVNKVATSVGMFPLVPAASFIQFAWGVSDCAAYRSSWIGTVDPALKALEQSRKETQASIGAAREEFGTLNQAGICDHNYTAAGSEACPGLQAAFSSIDNNISEGGYGKYPEFLSYWSEISSELGKPAPDLSRFGTMMHLIWDEGGAIASFKLLSDDAKKAKTAAEAEFKSLSDGAEAKRKVADSGLAGLSKERVDLITRAPAGFQARTAGTVSETFYALGKRSKNLSGLLADSRIQHDAISRQSYLSSVILAMENADDGYGQLTADIDALGTDARETVEQQKAEAEDELAQAKEYVESSPRSAESINLYNEAQSKLGAGDKAITLGDRFAAYSKAAALARAARVQRTYEDELAVKSSLDELEGLITNAEKDGINVATEKDTLLLLKSRSTSAIADEIESSISSIVSKARIKYNDDLTLTRTRLLDKLSLAGPAAADLYTDLSKYEQGVIASDGSIDYPNAIGRLKALLQNYQELEKTLDLYMGDIVGNTMSATARPVITGAKLDEPADILLDVVLENSRNYEARNVSVKVDMQAAVPFLYADIAEGREDVESLRTADGGKTLVLVFASVEPYESKHIILHRQSVIAHTTKSTLSAQGMGNGAARVSKAIWFELDMDVNRLILPDDVPDALIDGADASRPLAAGKHTLVSDAVMDDAYSEEMTNVKAYQIGTNSQVEYDVSITPAIPLESVIVFLDSLNDSSISGLDVVAATGEMVKDRTQLSQSQYAVTVTNLQKDKTTVLKVSYIVEDTGSFVQQQLDQLGSGNLSDSAKDLLAQARAQSDAGNYTNALELIEKAKAAEKDDAKDTAKLSKRFDELGTKVNAELAEITTALSMGNVSHPFMEKLSARKAELERVLAETATENLSGQVAALEKVDYGWLDSELTALQKDSYKQYNDLKERFFNAGNSSTPPEFLAFESAFNKLQTGNRLEYAVSMIQALQAVNLVVDAQEHAQEAQKSSLRLVFEQLKGEAQGVLVPYAKEAGTAKGTEYESLFSESEKSVNKKITDAEAALSGDGRVAWLRFDDLNRSRKMMEDTLATLKGESEAKLALVERLFNQTTLDDAGRKTVADRIAVMRSMVASGEYVNALRAGTAITTELETAARKDNTGLLVLGLTALAVLAAVAVYLIKQQKDEGSGKKMLRKLERLKHPKEAQIPKIPPPEPEPGPDHKHI